MASQSPMLARKSSTVQLRVTGTVGSASAAGSVLAKALAFAAVGGHARHALLLIDEVVPGEPLGQLAALRVPQPDPVADGELVRRRAVDRGLHLAGALDAVQL